MKPIDEAKTPFCVCFRLNIDLHHLLCLPLLSLSVHAPILTLKLPRALRVFPTHSRQGSVNGTLWKPRPALTAWTASCRGEKTTEDAALLSIANRLLKPTRICLTLFLVPPSTSQLNSVRFLSMRRQDFTTDN